ncbi:prepilin-type N-terminal cleavage/methylation domain-containing protein [uncultured Ferrimonas sp.]|uniref:prepilin-type N-terminal cleavage/methylation domain-containing protein n=1 Tax=uncultured Ferrimonas sp. TaxID=432640 RepID=UPI00261720BA|nr:prepilin-type N-terminal cleavage/methylation domain-containing protein [uncultured Ferrimonas sp.]
MKKQMQRGFTFVELVIVVVILGLLAAVALPRFINLTDEAEIAAAEGVGGGFAAAVGLVRAQWEVDGRPTTGVLINGINVGVNRFGYPSSDSNDSGTNLTAARCEGVFDDILQSTPTHSSATNVDLRDFRYFVSVENAGAGSVIDMNGNTVNNVDKCVYFLLDSLALNDTGRLVDPAVTQATAGAIGFDYNLGTGQVISFNN